MIFVSRPTIKISSTVSLSNVFMWAVVGFPLAALPCVSKQVISWRAPFTQNRGSTIGLACSRRSDCRAREKNSRREKKRGETRRGKGERTLAPPSSPSPPCFPGVQLNSLPTYRRALLSERLEQATIGFYYAVIPTRIFSPSRNLDGYFWHPASRSYS